MILMKSSELGLHKNSESDAGKVGQRVHEILNPSPTQIPNLAINFIIYNYGEAMKIYKQV